MCDESNLSLEETITSSSAMLSMTLEPTTLEIQTQPRLSMQP